MISGKQHKIRD